MTTYLDYNATSPLRPEVLTAMEPYFLSEFGNPSSFHRMGQRARNILEDSRKKLLEILDLPKGELIFTSSATEANNLAIFGIPAKHIVTSAIEHLSVLKPLEALAKKGVSISFIAPDEEGRVRVSDFEKSITPETGLVSLMAANNETGVLEPVHELAKMLRARGILFHVDAVQVFGKMAFDFKHLEADLITFSAHKIGGPKGIGALWIRDRLKLAPILFGGSHEKNLRAGTENVPSAVGFAKAAELASSVLPSEEKRIRALRDRLEEVVLERIPHTFVNGSRTLRLPNTSNISFEGVDTEALLMFLDSKGICASSGSACTSGSIDTSHVLQAMALSKDRLRSAVRFSLGFATSGEEVDSLAQNLPDWVNSLRASS